MPITQITHQGKKIIFVDYEGCRNKQDMLDMVVQSTDYLLAQPDKHLLILFDYTHAHGSSEYMRLAKESRDKIYQTKTTKSAAIGISGIKRILLNGYNALSSAKGMQPFDTKSAALDYLVGED
ncbi:hypothetical protein N6H18_04095 [Reichenbachiella agarivorans]|uniref:SpoIIAA-like n=1 Tax=Reichenbachiella agarivorans TaxID=2979464 RepID=A0ABY6CTE4_9BACT|nr:hypothetical protein [Reichenbachiella agarivorans]UXP33134.1 hypothetical protein N6H18_04095 [Reichenbachiella agarivorans]